MAKEIDESSLTLEITDLARGGSGVARDPNGRVVFVPFSAPGDRVRVRILSADKRFAQGELLEVIESSPVRVTPRCVVFGKCGGCQWQHIPYELQWKTKLSGVRQALSRVGIDIPTLEEIPAERIWEYRNRVQLRGEGATMGFYAAGTNRVVPASRCEIARPEINASWAAVQAEGAALGNPFKVELEAMDGSPDVKRVWNSRHGAGGFRQVHDDQNEKLKAWVLAAISPGRVVYDLYGGSGNFARPVAAEAKHVHCVDLSAASLKLENTAQITFHRSAVGPWLRAQKAMRGESASAILDPPREGLGEDWLEIIEGLNRLGVDETVAIGCDPDSWCRDLSRFVRQGWRVERAAVLDLFPQTAHVESVARLLRRR